MKGSVILVEKNGILIRTQYTSESSVRWMDGEKLLTDLDFEGYVVVRKNLVNEALAMVEKLREHLCSGYRVKNPDLLDIIKKLRDY